MRVILLLAAAVVLMLAPHEARAQSFNEQERAEIRAVVRDYLTRNPDVLREALNALEARTQAERQAKMVSDARDFSLGPADAPITLVEFFDYRCQYCHAAMSWVADLARSRRDVRIVFKEFPVLSEISLEAARAQVAAMPQGHYWDFHRALMAHRGQLDSDGLNTLARQSGIDVARMRAHMDDEAVTTLLQDNHAIAYEAGINSTPTFVIDGQQIAGFDQPRLEEALAEATRKAGQVAQR